MPTTPQAAAIYARISNDADGTRAGVERQLADCRKKADDLGWRIGAEYVDNDLSAYTGKPRPEYQRMMSDLADGLIDAVIVYNIDRLTRRPAELEDFAAALEVAKVRDVQFVTGDMDLSTDDGLLMARMLGAFAAKESANIGRRVPTQGRAERLGGTPAPGITATVRLRVRHGHRDSRGSRDPAHPGRAVPGRGVQPLPGDLAQ